MLAVDLKYIILEWAGGRSGRIIGDIPMERRGGEGAAGVGGGGEGALGRRAFRRAFVFGEAI